MYVTPGEPAARKPGGVAASLISVMVDNSQMATLTTIPLEILFLILQKLDTIDVIRLGLVSPTSRRHSLPRSALNLDQACRDLRESTQSHHVWLDQTQNHRRRTAALKLSIPSPTTLTTEALKRFAILQAKLRTRWSRLPDRHGGEKPKFAACGTILLPGWLDLIFLPGGEFVISIDDGDNSISVHRIELSGGQLSLTSLSNLSGGEHDQGEVGWRKMLPAMSPHPLFSYARANRSVAVATELPKPSILDVHYFWRSSIYFFGISPDGRANLETELPIPGRSKVHWVSGQGRIAGFVFQTGFESPAVTIIHLDHPGVTLQIQLPLDCEDPAEDLSTHTPPLRGGFEKTEQFLQVVEPWKVCFPTPDLAVVYGRDRVLAYIFPPFSTLSREKHLLDESPTWCWSSIMENNTGACRHRTSAEVFYDPSLPDHRFNIHLLHRLDHPDSRTYMGLITLKIDPSNPIPPSPGTSTSQRIVSRFPITGLTVMGTIHPGVYHSRTRLGNEGLDVWVTPLEDLSFSQARGEGEGRGSLWMFVSNDELEPDLEWESVDLDEVSGRVFIWGPAYRWKTPPETRIFVGELVS